jgi:glycine cleavage system H protein
MADKYYTKNGEWVARSGPRWKVGLSVSAVGDLGDVTFVALPQVGRAVAAGEAVCALEAVKAAADYYCPVDGRVSAVNSVLVTEPGLLNTSPEDDGWLFELEAVPGDSLDALLDEAAWKAWEAGR